jgi:hypothetical protein
MCGAPTITTTTTNNNNNSNVSKMALTKVHSHPYTDKCSGQTQKNKKKLQGKTPKTYIQKGENEMLMGLTTLPFEVIASSVLAGFCLLL